MMNTPLPQLPLEPNNSTLTASFLQAWRSVNPVVALLLLAGGFFLILLLATSGIFFFNGKPPAEAIGVLEISGVILDARKTLDQLESFAEDRAIKGVVVRLNSPGGAVAPSQEIHQAIRDYPKPLRISMGSVAASGAYYLACGAEYIYANAGSMTGSIGVIMEFTHWDKLYRWAKLERSVVKTGLYKDIGSSSRPMTVAERNLLQTMVADVLEQFKAAIVEGRHMSPAEVVEVADGRIFSGTQALKLRLVDRVGTLHDAVKSLAFQVGIHGKPHVVYADKKRSLWDWVGEEGEGAGASSDPARVLTRAFMSALLGQWSRAETLQPARLQAGMYFLWENF